MKAAIPVLLILSLAACEGFQRGFESDADGARDPIQVEQKAADSADAVGGTEEAGEARKRPPPEIPPAKPQRPQIVGDDLVGLTTAQAWELLSAPASTKKESPATVWAYEYAGCRLELFFYYDLESEEQRTLAFDLDVGSESVGGESFCLQELAKRAQALNATADAAATTSQSGVDGTAKTSDGEGTATVSGEKIETSEAVEETGQ